MTNALKVIHIYRQYKTDRDKTKATFSKWATHLEHLNSGELGLNPERYNPVTGMGIQMLSAAKYSGKNIRAKSRVRDTEALFRKVWQEVMDIQSYCEKLLGYDSAAKWCRKVRKVFRETFSFWDQLRVQPVQEQWEDTLDANQTEALAHQLKSCKDATAHLANWEKHFDKFITLFTLDFQEQARITVGKATLLIIKCLEH
jgi:hypothetical protein